MNIAIRSILALAIAAPLAAAAQQATGSLTPPAARITDEAIQADHDTYRNVQQRIQSLNAAGRPLANYHLSKAQCWLDVSFHEYTRNDRSPFPQQSLEESGRLVSAMEAGAALPEDTPLINDSARLRPDLWDKAQTLKKHAGFQCAQQNIACAEVELVHAGNEYRQQGWRHAAPYVQIAEDRLERATQSVLACPGPTPAVVAVPAPSAPATPVAVTLRARVLFVFDGFAESSILAASRKELQELVADVQARRLSVKSISISGHADRLNGTGRNDYNDELSRKRMQTVRDTLARMGLTSSQTSTAFRGDAEPLDTCRNVPEGARLRECLQSNRRVEVVVETEELRR